MLTMFWPCICVYFHILGKRTFLIESLPHFDIIKNVPFRPLCCLLDLQICWNIRAEIALLSAQLTVWSQRVFIMCHSVIKCTLIWLRDTAVVIHLQRRHSLLGIGGLQKMPPCFNIHCYKEPDSVLVCVCVLIWMQRGCS